MPGVALASGDAPWLFAVRADREADPARVGAGPCGAMEHGGAMADSQKGTVM